MLYDEDTDGVLQVAQRNISRQVPESFQGITTNGGWLSGRYGADGDTPLAQPQHQNSLCSVGGRADELFRNVSPHLAIVTEIIHIQHWVLLTGSSIQISSVEREREREILLTDRLCQVWTSCVWETSELQKQCNTAHAGSKRRISEKWRKIWKFRKVTRKCK